MDKLALIKEAVEKNPCKTCFYPNRHCKYYQVIRSFFPQYDCRQTTRERVYGVFKKLQEKAEAHDLPPTPAEKVKAKAAGVKAGKKKEPVVEVPKETKAAVEEIATVFVEPVEEAKEPTPEAEVEKPEKEAEPEVEVEEPKEEKPKKRRRRKKLDTDIEATE